VITVDDRAGSIDLAPPLRARGLPVQVSRLEYGDVRFVGNGPDGVPYLVGIEHKQLSDILKCITDGRFAGHQLPGLVESYNVIYLYIEGVYRNDQRTGILQVPGRNGVWRSASVGTRQFTFRELDNYLNTIELKGGVHVVRTYNQAETADKISNVYKWWTAKEWEEHRAHLAFDEAAETCRRAALVRPNLVRRIASELPGIGWEKSIAVARAFATPIDLVAADVEEWEAIPGIGRTMAKRIVEALRGNN
jgi:ERCC4-type nuclease